MMNARIVAGDHNILHVYRLVREHDHYLVVVDDEKRIKPYPPIEDRLEATHWFREFAGLFIGKEQYTCIKIEVGGIECPALAA